ncbi:MAG: ADP-glyceromanno-heptose 6-epimerase [Alphaproteobacteria bacterium]|nr:ADP-glyceromanno-heptose 6-epimerase [Alphaproteobacteria bacterium]
MKTILVTGGAGFIGSNLVAALLARGTHHVVVCDHFGTDDKWRNLAKHPVFEIIPPEQIFDWLEFNRSQVDVVFHLASISSTTEKDIDLILKHNFQLSLKLWRWCNVRSVRLIYASSSATYGGGEHGFDDSIDLAYLQKLQPLSGYGWSKHLFDMHVAGCVARGEINLPQWIGLKTFNTYGPNEYHKGDQQSVITKVASHAMQAGTVKIFRSYNPQYADGEQQRDMIYIKDVVRVLLWCMDYPRISGLFNCGTGQASTFNQMARGIFSALGAAPRISYSDMPEGLLTKYQYYTQANMQKLRSVGFAEEFTPLEAGIKDYMQNYLLKKDDPYL